MQLRSPASVVVLIIVLIVSAAGFMFGLTRISGPGIEPLAIILAPIAMVFNTPSARDALSEDAITRMQLMQPDLESFKAKFHTYPISDSFVEMYGDQRYLCIEEGGNFSKTCSNKSLMGLSYVDRIYLAKYRSLDGGRSYLIEITLEQTGKKYHKGLYYFTPKGHGPRLDELL